MITIYNLCNLLFLFSDQGIFTHWLDGSLLENIDWNDHHVGNQKPNNISILTENTLFNAENANEQIMIILRIYDITNQPEFDLNKNCTSAFTFIGCHARGWVAIHCEQKFLTTFVCLNHSKVSAKQMIYNLTSNALTRDLTCPKGWLFIDFECNYFIKPGRSFQDAHYTCENEGGVLLSTRRLPQLQRVELQITDMARVFQTTPLARFNQLTADDCAVLMSGVPFKYDSKPSKISHVMHVLNMLHSMTKRKTDVSFF